MGSIDRKTPLTIAGWAHYNRGELKIDLIRAKRVKLKIVLTAVVSALLAMPAPGEVTSSDVSLAIERGVAYLRRVQDESGYWKYQNNTYNQGVTGLALLALRATGAPTSDASLRAGVRYLGGNVQVSTRRTYQYSCMIMGLAACDPNRNRNAIANYATWLAQAQLGNGMWSYDGPGRGDNSNTQFAILGLKAAMDAGVRVPETVLRRANTHFRNSQQGDGGWGYTPGQAATGSMTTAGLTGLYVTGAALAPERATCGVHKRDRSIEGGLTWLGNNWSIRQNPGRGGGSWLYYYLYGVERVGVLSGRRTIGGRDWFREGATFLVGAQKRDGSWGGGTLDTIFALLFLAKGRAPVVVAKLARRTDWNNHPRDVANLVAFVGSVIGTPVTWQVVDVDDPLAVWMETPILYFNGKTSLAFKKKTVAKLVAYVESGGTIIAETICGQKKFDRSFRQFIEEGFAGEELSKLDARHGIYNSHFRLRPPKTRKPEGINYGCRTSVIYVPKAYASTWETNDVGNEAFKIGTNMVLYAVDREGLSDRLAETLLERVDAPRSVSGALSVGQIKHDGTWFTDQHAMSRLLVHVAERLDVNVSNARHPVGLLDGDLFQYPILYLEGYTRFKLSDDEVERLKLYLERGGFLLAEARCGSPQFDQSFRLLVRRLFGEDRLRILEPEHRIYRAAFDATKVRYRKAIRDEHPDGIPELEAVSVDNRIGIVYTRYDLGCGWNGQHCPGIAGLEPASARALGANIIVYALTH